MSQWLATSKPLKYCASTPTTANVESGVLYTTTPITKTENTRGSSALVKSTIAAEHFSVKPCGESVTNIALCDDTPTLYCKQDDNTVNELPLISDGLIFETNSSGATILTSLGTSSAHSKVVLPHYLEDGTPYVLAYRGSTLLFANCVYLTIGQSLTQSASTAKVFNTAKVNAIMLANKLYRLHCYNTTVESGAVARCSALTEVVIDYGTWVYASAFLNVPSLTRVWIKNDSVVAPKAFYGAPNLRTIYVQNHPWHCTYSGILFDTLSSAAINKRYALPEHVIWVPPSCPESFQFPTTVTSYLKRIGACSFSHCAQLRILSLTNLVSTLDIDANAFMSNTTIEHIYVPFASSSSLAKNAPWGAVNATIHYTDTE